MNDIIHTQRLDLIPLSPAELRAAIDEDRSTMGRLLGVAVPATWEIRREFLELRLRQLEANPALQPWLIRGISLRDESRLVGDIGFHSEPFAARAPSEKSLELGYGVLAAWQRRGFAREAIGAMIQWACEKHEVRRFVLSINPENHPSQALAAKLGFRKIGSRIDDIDGPENIFERIL
ncbi:MAG: GNAT family N-acetyltransferase [Chthoniobacteraceae bacterium]